MNTLDQIKWILCLDSQALNTIQTLCQEEPLYKIRKEKFICELPTDKQNKDGIIHEVDSASQVSQSPCIVFQNRHTHQQLLFDLKDIFGKFNYVFWEEKTTDIILALCYPDDDIIESWVSVLEGKTEDFTQVVDINPPTMDISFLNALAHWRTTHLGIPKLGPYEYVQELMATRVFSLSEFRCSSNKDIWVHKKCKWLSINVRNKTQMGLLSQRVVGTVGPITGGVVEKAATFGLAAATTNKPSSNNSSIYLKVSGHNDEACLTIDFPNLSYYTEVNKGKTFKVRLQMPTGGFEALKHMSFCLLTGDGVVFFEVSFSDNHIVKSNQDNDLDYMVFECRPDNGLKIYEVVDQIRRKQIQFSLDLVRDV